MKTDIEKIKYVMRKKGITQKYIADSLHISVTTLSYYFTERNKKDIPLDILDGICNILEIDKDSLNITVKDNSNTEKIISELLQLKPEYKNIVANLIEYLLKSQNKEGD